MKREDIFRPEAVRRRDSYFQSDALMRPPSAGVIVSLIAVIFFLALVGLWQGHYTSTTLIAGEFGYDKGSVKLSSPVAGRIAEIYVKEGEKVEAGQVLLRISTAHQINSHEDADAARRLALITRKGVIEAQLSGERNLVREQIKGALNKRQYLRQETSHMLSQRSLLMKKLSNSRGELALYKNFLAKGFISDIGYLQKENVVLDTEMHAEQLQKDIVSTQRMLGEAELEIGTAEQQGKQTIAELEKTRLQLVQDIEETEYRRVTVVRADRPGTVGALLVKEGQSINTNDTVAFIMPSESHLVLRLFAPSRAIGFIEQGQTINVMYEPFPYQKYGLQKAVVSGITALSVPAGELGVAGAPGGESFYVVTAKPAQEHIQIGTRKVVLRPGMKVSAEIPTSSKRLFEWILLRLS